MNRDKREDRELRCALSYKEVQDYSDAMASKVQEGARVEEDKKAVTSRFKATLDQLSATVHDLSLKVTNKYEIRTVKCEWFFEWDRDVKRLRRADTGEIIQTEAVTEFERQQFFKFDPDDDEEEPEDEAPRVTDPKEPEDKVFSVEPLKIANKEDGDPETETGAQIDPETDEPVYDPDQACIKCGYMFDECVCGPVESKNG